jgi:CheY-like chemotaxis protein
VVTDSARVVHGHGHVSGQLAIDPAWARRVWVVEDEPAAATLAAELCEQGGAVPTLFRDPLPYLSALRRTEPPTAIVLDWRLEHELSAALFLATRHRHPRLPVVFWTGSAPELLPAMIRADERTRIVDKAAGTSAFEDALAWALASEPVA